MILIISLGSKTHSVAEVRSMEITTMASPIATAGTAAIPDGHMVITFGANAHAPAVLPTGNYATVRGGRVLGR